MIILSKEENQLLPLKNIYLWAKKKKFDIKEEHIIIYNIPVQFLPVYNNLIREAVINAREVILYGVKTFILNPEYLIAIMLDTFKAKDKLRIIQIMEETKIDNELLNEILNKYNLMEIFNMVSRQILWIVLT